MTYLHALPCRPPAPALPIANSSAGTVSTRNVAPGAAATVGQARPVAPPPVRRPPAAAATQPSATVMENPPFSGSLRFPPPFHVAFPPTGLPAPPPPRLPGCLAAFSVARFGAVGDGATDNAAALAAADAGPGVALLFFPRGDFRVARSLALSKPVVMGAGTRFVLDAGVQLVLAAQPKRPPNWLDPMFRGPGVWGGGGGLCWGTADFAGGNGGAPPRAACCQGVVNGLLTQNPAPHAFCRRRPGAHGRWCHRGLPRLVERPRRDRWAPAAQG